MQGLYQKHMHNFRLLRKHVQSFKKTGIKLYEEGEKRLSSQCGKSDKK